MPADATIARTSEATLGEQATSDGGGREAKCGVVAAVSADAAI